MRRQSETARGREWRDRSCRVPIVGKACGQDHATGSWTLRAVVAPAAAIRRIWQPIEGLGIIVFVPQGCELTGFQQVWFDSTGAFGSSSRRFQRAGAPAGETRVKSMRRSWLSSVASQMKTPRVRAPSTCRFRRARCWHPSPWRRWQAALNSRAAARGGGALVRIFPFGRLWRGQSARRRRWRGCTARRRPISRRPALHGRGRRYYPTETAHQTQVGMASYYGAAFHGRKTANGEVFDMASISAAHPTTAPAVLCARHEHRQRPLDRRARQRSRALPRGPRDGPLAARRRPARLPAQPAPRASRSNMSAGRRLAAPTTGCSWPSLRTDGEPATIDGIREPVMVASTEPVAPPRRAPAPVVVAALASQPRDEDVDADTAVQHAVTKVAALHAAAADAPVRSRHHPGAGDPIAPTPPRRAAMFYVSTRAVATSGPFRSSMVRSAPTAKSSPTANSAIVCSANATPQIDFAMQRMVQIEKRRASRLDASSANLARAQLLFSIRLFSSLPRGRRRRLGVLVWRRLDAFAQT